MKFLFCTVLLWSSLGYSNETEKSSIEFKKVKIRLQKILISVEVAESEAQQARGLMFRRELGENSGMLFVYDYEKPLTFWMKNTFIPLSIAFFDRNRVLINVEEMKASKSMMQVDVDRANSSRPARYALEMNHGWFRRNKVRPGHRFEFLDKKIKDQGLENTSPRMGSPDFVPK